MPKILVLYHYYFPDDVVSAVHFTGLCEGLARKGYEVEVWPANRRCHPLAPGPRGAGNPDQFTVKPGTVNGVTVRRVWRPGFSQHSFLGRILNSIWMQKAWWWRLALRPGCRPDVILTGTDPLLANMLTPFLKLLRPKAKFAHWCFDLYPEAAVAGHLMPEDSVIIQITKVLMNWGYKACGLVADIGPCMRERLGKYGIKRMATLTPWALEEFTEPPPAGLGERKELFGDAALGLLYSGNLGRAHDFYLTLKLARLMRSGAAPLVGSSEGSGSPARHNQGTPPSPGAGGQVAIFAYGVRGSRLEALRRAVNPEDTNLRFAGFAPPEKLAARLSAPDAHLVSLRPEWAGLVVPSKFFGALAAGRPVLFEGDGTSSIARWIREYGVGWVLRPDNLEETAADLSRFAEDTNRKAGMFRHCYEVYQAHFSKAAVITRWDDELRALLS